MRVDFMKDKMRFQTKDKRRFHTKDKMRFQTKISDPDFRQEDISY